MRRVPKIARVLLYILPMRPLPTCGINDTERRRERKGGTEEGLILSMLHFSHISFVPFFFVGLDRVVMRLLTLIYALGTLYTEVIGLTYLNSRNRDQQNGRKMSSPFSYQKINDYKIAV